MGRTRKHQDPFNPLPRGLYAHGNKFRAKKLDGKWENFDGPLDNALTAYRIWRGDTVNTNTVEWLLDWYLTMIMPRQKLAPATMDDYREATKPLKIGIGKLAFKLLTHAQCAVYRDARGEAAPGRLGKEMQVGRNAYRAAMDRGMVLANPFKEVSAPATKKRERLVTNTEFLALYDRVSPSIKTALLLALRTLQRPADVLKMGPKDVQRIGDQIVLNVRQNKRGALVSIIVEGDLARIINAHPAYIKTFVYTQRGGESGASRQYTVKGVSGMIWKAAHPENKPEQHIPDIGLRDMRAKGATDLYRANVPLREISALLGHKSEQTTYRYIKQFISDPVRGNQLPMVA